MRRLDTYMYILHNKVKDIYQDLDLNTKIKANSRNCTNHLEISKWLFCVVYGHETEGVCKMSVAISERNI